MCCEMEKVLTALRTAREVADSVGRILELRKKLLRQCIETMRMMLSEDSICLHGSASRRGWRIARSSQDDFEGESRV